MSQFPLTSPTEVFDPRLIENASQGAGRSADRQAQMDALENQNMMQGAQTFADMLKQSMAQQHEMQMQQQKQGFEAGENQKSRDFTTSERKGSEDFTSRENRRQDVAADQRALLQNQISTILAETEWGISMAGGAGEGGPGTAGMTAPGMQPGGMGPQPMGPPQGSMGPPGGGGMGPSGPMGPTASPPPSPLLQGVSPTSSSVSPVGEFGNVGLVPATLNFDAGKMKAETRAAEHTAAVEAANFRVANTLAQELSVPEGVISQELSKNFGQLVTLAATGQIVVGQAQEMTNKAWEDMERSISDQDLATPIGRVMEEREGVLVGRAWDAIGAWMSRQGYGPENPSPEVQREIGQALGKPAILTLATNLAAASPKLAVGGATELADFLDALHDISVSKLAPGPQAPVRQPGLVGAAQSLSEAQGQPSQSKLALNPQMIGKQHSTPGQPMSGQPQQGPQQVPGAPVPPEARVLEKYQALKARGMSDEEIQALVDKIDEHGTMQHALTSSEQGSRKSATYNKTKALSYMYQQMGGMSEALKAAGIKPPPLKNAAVLAASFTNALGVHLYNADSPETVAAHLDEIGDAAGLDAATKKTLIKMYADYHENPIVRASRGAKKEAKAAGERVTKAELSRNSKRAAYDDALYDAQLAGIARTQQAARGIREKGRKQVEALMAAEQQRIQAEQMALQQESQQPKQKGSK